MHNTAQIRLTYNGENISEVCAPPRATAGPDPWTPLGPSLSL